MTRSNGVLNGARSAGEEIGLADVPAGGILPKGWKPDAESIAAAIHDERDGE
jgi:hypothetical protein